MQAVNRRHLILTNYISSQLSVPTSSHPEASGTLVAEFASDLGATLRAEAARAPQVPANPGLATGTDLYMARAIYTAASEFACFNPEAKLDWSPAGRHLDGMFLFARRFASGGNPVRQLERLVRAMIDALNEKLAGPDLDAYDREVLNRNLAMALRLRPMFTMLVRLDSLAAVHPIASDAVRTLLLLWAVGEDLASVAPRFPAPTAPAAVPSAPEFLPSVEELVVELWALLSK